MSNAVVRARVLAASRQNYRCFYCGLPMWAARPGDFAARYRLTKRQAMSLQCTAEHLLAQCDGGTDAAANIVAACVYCNRKRHARRVAPDPLSYRDLVRRRIRHGHWLVATLPRALQVHARWGRNASAGSGGTSNSSAARSPVRGSACRTPCTARRRGRIPSVPVRSSPAHHRAR